MTDEQDMITAECPGCGARYCVPFALVGTSGTCAACDAAVPVVLPEQPPEVLTPPPWWHVLICRFDRWLWKLKGGRA